MSSIPENLPREEMLIVLPKLCESHRFYHNLDHISRMLHAHQLWKYRTDIVWNSENEMILYLAILYHDVVYDIKTDQISNEKKSANFFLNNSYWAFNQPVRTKVESMILATEQHFDASFSTDDSIINYMLDLDLMQLCTSDYGVLINDNKNIDKEFLTEHHEQFVYESRYNFIANVMQPNAKLRELKNPILTSRMAYNIEKLRQLYKSKC